MFDVTYSDRERHIKEHEILLALLTDKTHQYRSEKIELDDIVSYLFEWYALHTT